MEISDVITRVQRQFGDESGVQVTEADVIRWINDSQQEAVLQNTFLLNNSESYITVANQQSYLLADDCIDIRVIRYTEPGATSSYPLKYMNIKEMDEYIGNWNGLDFVGEPQVYTRSFPGTTNIRVFPVPNHGLGLFTVEYGRYPVNVTKQADTIDLPLYLHQYVVEFCLMKAYEMDEEWESADRKAAYVQSTLDANFARDEQLSKDVYPSIIATAGDYD